MWRFDVQPRILTREVGYDGRTTARALAQLLRRLVPAGPCLSKLAGGKAGTLVPQLFGRLNVENGLMKNTSLRQLPCNTSLGNVRHSAPDPKF